MGNSLALSFHKRLHVCLMRDGRTAQRLHTTPTSIIHTLPIMQRRLRHFGLGPRKISLTPRSGSAWLSGNWVSMRLVFVSAFALRFPPFFLPIFLCVKNIIRPPPPESPWWNCACIDIKVPYADNPQLKKKSLGFLAG